VTLPGRGTILVNPSKQPDSLAAILLAFMEDGVLLRYNFIIGRTIDWAVILYINRQNESAAQEIALLQKKLSGRDR